MAPDLEQEAALIRAFIIPTKRESSSYSLESPSAVEALLRSKGASDLCYAISTDPEPGSLGYFEGEEIGARYVLERSGRVKR